MAQQGSQLEAKGSHLHVERLPKVAPKSPAPSVRVDFVTPTSAPRQRCGHERAQLRGRDGSAAICHDAYQDAIRRTRCASTVTSVWAANLERDHQVANAIGFGRITSPRIRLGITTHPAPATLQWMRSVCRQCGNTSATDTFQGWRARHRMRFLLYDVRVVASICPPLRVRHRRATRMSGHVSPACPPRRRAFSSWTARCLRRPSRPPRPPTTADGKHLLIRALPGLSHDALTITNEARSGMRLAVGGRGCTIQR